jgi:DNA polymerase-3 subunit delta'
VVVLEAAETMAEAAANGLLKTLEEPGNATLVLLAPGHQAILPTLVSRCQTIPFQRLKPEDMARVLGQTGHGEILHHGEVMALAQGSPGQAIVAYSQLQAIPTELLIHLGRQVAKTLDLEAQLWLVDYLLHWYWQQQATAPTAWLLALETAKRHLRRFVTPRLVWEVTLMQALDQESLGKPT